MRGFTSTGGLSQNVTFGCKLICMMLCMNRNVMRRLLLLKLTEVVEVTETINILIENDVEDVQGSTWAQLELNIVPDVVIPLLEDSKIITKEEQASSRRKK
jgi:hypothetical protein